MPSNSGDDKVPLCFVVGPIGKDGSVERKHSDLLLNAIIKYVLQGDEFGFIVKRADEDADPGMIGDRVVSDIINAELVVADLTDLNPNAFYELGIRHSTLKPTIHVARAGTALPFDTVAHRTIFIDLTDWHSIEQASNLLRCIASHRASSHKRRYRVHHFWPHQWPLEDVSGTLRCEVRPALRPCPSRARWFKPPCAQPSPR